MSTTHTLFLAFYLQTFYLCGYWNLSKTWIQWYTACHWQWKHSFYWKIEHQPKYIDLNSSGLVFKWYQVACLKMQENIRCEQLSVSHVCLWANHQDWWLIQSLNRTQIIHHLHFYSSPCFAFFSVTERQCERQGSCLLNTYKTGLHISNRLPTCPLLPVRCTYTLLRIIRAESALFSTLLSHQPIQHLSHPSRRTAQNQFTMKNVQSLKS